MKIITCFLLFVSISMQAFAQDTTYAFINGTKAGKCITKQGQKTSFFYLKKSCFKNYKSFILQVKGTNTTGTFYNRELEINGDSTFFINEIKDQPGRFDITETKSKEMLLAGKTLKLYLFMEPSNPRIMAPSKRIYLCDLKTK